MSEGFMRHFVSFIGMLVCLLTFIAGYKAGAHGIWWAGIGVVIIYGLLYVMLEV